MVKIQKRFLDLAIIGDLFLNFSFRHNVHMVKNTNPMSTTQWIFTNKYVQVTNFYPDQSLEIFCTEKAVLFLLLLILPHRGTHYFALYHHKIVCLLLNFLWHICPFRELIYLSLFLFFWYRYINLKVNQMIVNGYYCPSVCFSPLQYGLCQNQNGAS